MAGEGEEKAERVGVLLLNLGGPDRPENVRPFLWNLFRDPDVLKVPGGVLVRTALAWWIAKRRSPQVERNYREVGGSPLLPRTRAQERALEKRLIQRGGHDSTHPRFHVRTAMRYWHPRAEQAVRELLECGVDRFIALPLYPHSCRATTGSSVKELREVLARLAPRLPLEVIESYARDERYVAALARCVEEGLAQARSKSSEEPTLLFSAHGLPKRIVDAGDPYVDEISATISGVVELLKTRGAGATFRGEPLLSFQSRAGPVKWIEPSTETTIERLAAARCRSLVIVPVSFVSDHIETVHEIDLVFARKAAASGIRTFIRTPALDVRPDFIESLALLTLGRLSRQNRTPHPAVGSAKGT